jgi:flagellar protein FlaJ
VKTFQNRKGPKERQWAKRFMYTVVPLGGLFALLLGFLYGFHLLLIVLGISLLPTGVMAWLDNGKVNKRDQELAPFLRSLGNVTASMGTTIGASMEKIDRRSLGTLEPTIRRLQTRLRKQISPDKSWDAFRDEAGSELISRGTRMFVDGVTLGGPPERVGAIAAEFAMDAALMRSRRLVSSAPFAFLVIPLHFAMTGLMVFVLEIMKAFNTRISVAADTLESQADGSGLAMLPSLPVFQQHDMGMLSVLTMVSLVSMTISNALTPKFALGGHSTITALFGGITLIMTGFNLFIIPPVAGQVLLPAAA